MADSASSAPIPERLVKHTVRYADHHAVNWDHLSPMMRHYVDTKEQYPYALVLYRVGDFFETFFQDAITVARELELVLTSKDAGKQVGRVPLAGLPHHALDRYCALLVEKGYAIAICDQVEDPAQAQGLVKRDVTRVITPGTVLEEGMLDASQNNFLAAAVMAGDHWGLAYADVSTGEFLTTQGDHPDQLSQELMRLQPAEVLFPTSAPDLGAMLRPGEATDQLPPALPRQFCYTLRPQGPFSLAEAKQHILQRFRLRSLEGLGCDQLPLAVRAAGGLLHYLDATQKTVQSPLQPLATYTLSAFLVLDHQSRRNLEITQTARDGTYSGSLLWALDRTVTAMGGRSLRRWLLQPLLDAGAIRQRQGTIQELLNDGNLRQLLQQRLKQIYDLERLAGRAGSGTANARDLVALAESFLRLPELAALVASARSVYLQALQQVPPTLEQLGQTLRAHLVDTPPLSLTEGHLIRSGIHAPLDDLRQQVASDQQWIAQLEGSERRRTGIPSLKVGFNKAFGYYISISRAKADQAPADYIRKQTLTNEERYITPELKEREARVFTLEAQINALEYEIFQDLRQQVGTQVALIRQVARAVAAADVLCGLAEVAVFQGYCCPTIEGIGEGLDNGSDPEPSRAIAIDGGRHPVVEQLLPAGFFVPNATHLGTMPRPTEGSPTASTAPPIASQSPQDLIILTGPNASGKSCYLRQVGLIQLMAQTGSFVPATAARLGICDRIFTRVGAVDDLATGQSTFMVEMNETANILNHATPHSLVLLDEIGRGTATFDGLSIAWAVAEYLAVELQSRTIFATHYHELNQLADLVPTIANYQVTVQEMPDQIIFLHQVQPGGADKSYGIEAGRLAGLPPTVIARARSVMAQIESHSTIAVEVREAPPRRARRARSAKGTYRLDPQQQLDLFGR